MRRNARSLDFQANFAFLWFSTERYRLVSGGSLDSILRALRRQRELDWLRVPAPNYQGATTRIAVWTGGPGAS